MDGIRTTCASKMLENFVPPYDANVIEKLKAENYVLLGKNKYGRICTDGGSTNRQAHSQRQETPFDLSRDRWFKRLSAAVVSAGLAPAALRKRHRRLYKTACFILRCYRP